jgi:hypothetical protein
MDSLFILKYVKSHIHYNAAYMQYTISIQHIYIYNTMNNLIFIVHVIHYQCIILNKLFHLLQTLLKLCVLYLKIHMFLYSSYDTLIYNLQT